VTLLVVSLLYVLLAIAAVKAKHAGMSGVEVALCVLGGVLCIPVVTAHRCRRRFSGYTILSFASR
jgi:hypothetical protein